MPRHSPIPGRSGYPARGNPPASYYKVVADADEVLAVLGANNGVFPKPQEGDPSNPDSDASPGNGHGGKGNGFKRWGLSAEPPYESRFFSVLLDEEGQVLQTDTGQIAAVDAEDAAACAQGVFATGSSSGFWGHYRYLRYQSDSGIRVIFLDCNRSLSSFRSTLLTSLSLAGGGLAAVLVLLLIVSKRMIRPVVESYEKQKRFITDAGHELKTPLTIISADTDLAEMDCGENQWLTDIRRQAQRLTGLTNDLIYLSRMEEEQPKLSCIEFPISDVVEEMAHAFLAPATSQGKAFSISVQPMLAYTGDEKSIRQLVSILVDNALKYSPSGGQMALSLEKQGRNLVLTVSNTTDQAMEREQLAHLFDRFYRTDQSRNSQTGGYGLGLSIAKSIVGAHKGKIKSDCRDGHTLSITVTLPS